MHLKMPRTGKHPLKRAAQSYEHHHRQITVTTVIHIPMLAGYWAESLDVLRLFFESLYASTALPFDLMVFDNNSCEQVQDYLLDLRRRNKIQYLILSEYNLKKLGAMDHLFSSAPGEYVAFADSDVYFLPGWLEASIEVMKTFPEAGQVSAIPTIDRAQHNLDHTHQGIQANKDLVLESGVDLIPERYVDAHIMSLGRNKGEYLQSAGSRNDIRITRNRISAYVSAQDFQFITRREVIERVLPLKVRHASEYFDPIYSPIFEAKVDELGYWRLSTKEYLIHHMGNHMPNLSVELGEILNDIPRGVEPGTLKERSWIFRLRRRFWESGPIRQILKKIYTWAYARLFENQ